jgi:hypothetical protein
LSHVYLTCKISDHFPIVFFKETQKTESKPKVILKRDFSDQNVNKFSNFLKNTPWLNVLEELEPNCAFNIFSDQFETLHSNFFSPKLVKFNQNFHKKEKWITAGILTSRLTKLSLSKKCIQIPSPENIEKFKKYRNLFNKTVRTSKKLYFSHELERNTSNLKKTWALLNEAINKKGPSSTIDALKINNLTITDPKEMANHFNVFFTSIADEISKTINPINPVQDPPIRLEKKIYLKCPMFHYSKLNLF